MYLNPMFKFLLSGFCFLQNPFNKHKLEIQGNIFNLKKGIYQKP